VKRHGKEEEMAIKDILLALTAYPDPTPVSAVEEAVVFAVALGSRISAIAIEEKIELPANALANALLDLRTIVAAEARRSLINAKKLLAAFKEAAEKRAVFEEAILERCLTSQAPDLLVGHARLRDLTIIPTLVSDDVDKWYAEPILFGSGRPVLVLPDGRKSSGVFALDEVVVAWDFSRPAARAVADSLPILARARRVCLLTVTNEKIINTERSAAELAKHLARHDIHATVEDVDAAGRSIGEVLDSYVRSHQTNLLVMGAYGHSRVRDFILGGATKSMLSSPPLPIFLSH
jgi:nucleotide-binding universal stress UspA family protein